METFPTKSLPAFLWHFVKKHKWGFIISQLFLFGWTLDATIWPYVLGQVVSTIQNYTGEREQIWTAISGMIFIGASLWLTVEFMFRASGVAMMKTFPKFEADLRMSMYRYVNQHSHSFFANQFAGSMANKISDMPRSSKTMFTMAMETFIPSATATLIATSIFAYLHPLFGVVIFTWVLGHTCICLYTAKKCQTYFHKHSESRSSLVGRMVDSFTNNVSVRIFSRRKFEYQNTLRYQEDEVEKYKDGLWYIEKTKVVIGIFCFLWLGVLLTSLQIYCYKNGIIELGDLVYTFSAGSEIAMMAWMSGLQMPHFFQEIGVCKQALSLIQAPIAITDKKDAKPIKISKGEIEFRNVTFNYERNENLFIDQNIILKAGQKVGLVGFSGSGKTTFVNLILRYFDIKSGEILIDGKNIADVTQDSLREQIAMIPQEPTLFHRTLMENIRYGDLSAGDKKVMAVSKKANCHEFISKLEDKYNTMVGERGIKLSGGQRQRISIARAMLKDAPILILDEATSALDSVTERYIQKSLKGMMKNRTTVVIAHRLSTLSDMDRILVFKEGAIIEDGTHEDLLKANGHYTYLWQSQRDGFIPQHAEDNED